MWVNVPFEYTNKSNSIVTDSSTKTAGVDDITVNGNVYVNHLETSKNAAGTETTVVKSSINVKGSDATSVTAVDGGIVVTSHDTKYTMTHSESAASKTVSLVEDGTTIATFTFDAWHEGA